MHENNPDPTSLHQQADPEAAAEASPVPPDAGAEASRPPTPEAEQKPSGPTKPRGRSTPYVREFRSTLAMRGLHRIETYLDHDTLIWLRSFASSKGITLPNYIRAVLARHVSRSLGGQSHE